MSGSLTPTANYGQNGKMPWDPREAETKPFKVIHASLSLSSPCEPLLQHHVCVFIQQALFLCLRQRQVNQPLLDKKQQGLNPTIICYLFSIIVESITKH